MGLRFGTNRFHVKNPAFPGKSIIQDLKNILMYIKSRCFVFFSPHLYLTGRIWPVPSTSSSRCQLARHHRNHTPAERRSIAGTCCCGGLSTRPWAESPLNAHKTQSIKLRGRRDKMKRNCEIADKTDRDEFSEMLYKRPLS